MCVQGSGDLARARRLTQESLLKWLNALRPVTSNVTSRVEFTCNAPDGYVTVSNSVQRAYAMASNVWVNGGGVLRSSSADASAHIARPFA